MINPMIEIKKKQVSRPQNLTPGVIFRVESQSEVEICRKMAAEWKSEEKLNKKIILSFSLFSYLFSIRFMGLG